MRILKEEDYPFKSLSLIEVNSIDISPVYEIGNPIPVSLFLEFDGESVAEYPMNGTEETFKDAMTAYNTIIKTLSITGYCNMSDFGAEIL